jgi:hypothetical protein
LLDESVLQTIETGNDCSPEGGAPPEEDAESDSDSDDEETNIVGPPTQALMFEIDVDVDINSKVLRDMVSVEPVVQEEAQPRGPLNMAQQGPMAPNWNW